MTADEYDTGEESSPTNRTRSGGIFVVGGDEGDRTAPAGAGASSESLDADGVRGTADGGPFVAERQDRARGTADETPYAPFTEATHHD